MPYSNGTFTLYTPGNPVVTGTVIASSWANNTLQDIRDGLSNRGTSIEINMSAAGSTISDAQPVTATYNFFSTVASGTGARLPLPTTGAQGPTYSQVMIYNGGANILSVYATSGSIMNGLSNGARMYLPQKTAATYYWDGQQRWAVVLSA